MKHCKRDSKSSVSLTRSKIASAMQASMPKLPPTLAPENPAYTMFYMPYTMFYAIYNAIYNVLVPSTNTTELILPSACAPRKALQQISARAERTRRSPKFGGSDKDDSSGKYSYSSHPIRTPDGKKRALDIEYH